MTDKSVLVIGATSSLARALAVQLAKDNINLILSSRNVDFKRFLLPVLVRDPESIFVPDPESIQVRVLGISDRSQTVE